MINIQLQTEVQNLVQMADNDVFETGKLSSSDYQFEALRKQCAMMDLYIMLHGFFFKTKDWKRKLGILTIIRLVDDPSEISLYSSFARSGLMEEDNEVFEAAVRCFENWGVLDSIFEACAEYKIGVYIHERPKWLMEYMRMVLEDIRSIKRKELAGEVLKDGDILKTTKGIYHLNIFTDKDWNGMADYTFYNIAKNDGITFAANENSTFEQVREENLFLSDEIGELLDKIKPTTILTIQGKEIYSSAKEVYSGKLLRFISTDKRDNPDSIRLDFSFTTKLNRHSVDLTFEDHKGHKTSISISNKECVFMYLRDRSEDIQLRRLQINLCDKVVYAYFTEVGNNVSGDKDIQAS